LQPGAIVMSCFITLKKKGLRLTRPRKLILDYFHDNEGHLTAEEIIHYVHDKTPEVNKSTIYRTLELLEKNECVYKSESMGRTIYHHAVGGHHHHMICRRCGKTIACEEDIFNPVAELLQVKYGFQIDFKHIVMRGFCATCMNQSS
jgi:Fur family transcriptional regulator, ferric uptake regulator